jgi:hypothetical protein
MLTTGHGPSIANQQCSGFRSSVRRLCEFWVSSVNKGKTLAETQKRGDGENSKIGHDLINPLHDFEAECC